MSLTENKTYRILGVDPGTVKMGYALLEINGSQMKSVDIGVIFLDALSDHPTRLLKILERLQSIIITYKPTIMAVEAPFYAKNVQSMLKLGRAQGVAIAVGMDKGLDIFEYSPRKIKQSVTGNGNASKEQVAFLLQSQLKVDLAGQLLDATDALAVAVCHFYQNGKISTSTKKTPVKKSKATWEKFLVDNPDRLK
ncbi:MAG: crossover junction endodeoxyribonuclease RuvC [Saprospiraceae bacterium]|nr:crossover junction endodeoxyribonuclease RuvC [Saprospiraceae bacterium]